MIGKSIQKEIECRGVGCDHAIKLELIHAAESRRNQGGSGIDFNPFLECSTIRVWSFETAARLFH
jgi:hypothetical protein